MDKTIVGLDLSLTSTGWFIIDKDKKEYGEIKTNPKKFTNIIERCEYIADTIIEKIKKLNKVDLIIMEDYFSGTNSQTVILLATLGTIVRYKLLENNLSYITVMPTQIKKYETGNGNAHKDNILKSIFKNHQVDVQSNNIADACAIAYLGLGYLEYQQGSKQFSKYQIEVLKKVVKDRSIVEPYKNKGEKNESK